MKKLSLNKLELNENNLLSNDEKKQTFGGSEIGCGDDGSGIEWILCPSRPLCVADYSECW